MLEFKIQAKSSEGQSRTGTISTEHGKIPTPIFMPVGTAGTVKALHQRELSQDLDAKIILGNTYHLYLRPGMDVLKQAGGLHKFMNWERPLLTDSGGYQVYSLAQSRKISEEGVEFQSHIDGSKHLFTPENVIDIQRGIGADIIMAFDECPPYPCEYDYAKNSMHLTHRWLDRCIKAMNKTQGKYGYEQNLFPILQGSVYKDLRSESAKYISETDLPGCAIGGLSVGEPHEMMYEVCDWVTDILPKNKPRYLMGVGTPENLLECIDRGIDMFDCVMPTRNARHGMIFTSEGILNIRNEKWKNDFSTLDENVDLFINKTYSKAYLRHLIIGNEILGAQIASIQNLGLYLWLMKEARQHIAEDSFSSWKKEMIEKLSRRL
ncbi:tRNA guanosine(34) transglycosylase Tgt [Hyphobacterium sp. CCMP332]|nr:tRNA guanosine(34) transglycosylase Tgt [Hyphobacterium sp. CCMP332]